MAPATTAGKTFLICFAIVGVPLVGACFAMLARAMLEFLERLAVRRMEQVRESFKHFDKDDNESLDAEEFCQALQELDPKLTTAVGMRMFHAGEDEQHNKDKEMNYTEFVSVVIKHNLLEKTLNKRIKIRMLISLCAFFAWLVLGMVVFASIETWDHQTPSISAWSR